MQTRRRFNYNTIAALLFVVLGIVLLVIIPHQVDRPTLLFGRAPSGLDPDLFPRLVAGGLILLGVWYFFVGREMTDASAFHELDREAVINVLVTLAVLTAYALLMTRIGFTVSSVLVIAALSTFYGNRSIVLGLIFSVGVPVAIFYTFTRLLGVSLPTGFPI